MAHVTHIVQKNEVFNCYFANVGSKLAYLIRLIPYHQIALSNNYLLPSAQVLHKVHFTKLLSEWV